MVQNAANWLKSGQKGERVRLKIAANYLFWSHFFARMGWRQECVL